MVAFAKPGRRRPGPATCLPGLPDRPKLRRAGDVSIYGQESNDTTWRLATMNRAIRGIDEEFEEVTEGEDEVGEIHVEELEGVADA